MQKLALFAAFLDWIGETDGNCTLLKRVRGAYGRILKWVLDDGEGRWRKLGWERCVVRLIG